MPSVFTVSRAYRRGGSDVVVVEASGPNGEAVQVQVWWSHLQPLSAAQRRAVVGQALAEALAARAEVEVGLTGNVSG